METATLPADVCDAIIRHARAELPNECCGLLLGCVRIERAVPMRSDPRSPEAYFMEPEQQLAVFAEMEARSEQLLGIYHSHPAGPAEPSGLDLQLAFHLDALYVIIALSDAERPEIEAYVLQNGQFNKVNIYYTGSGLLSVL